MIKIDWGEKLDRLIEGEVNSWILVDKKGNKFIDEMGIRWLKQYLKEDVAFWIAERLSSQLSDLKEEMEGMKKHYFANFRKYGSYPPTKNAEEVEDVIKNFENMGFDNAIDQILSLLDKKAGEKK